MVEKIKITSVADYKLYILPQVVGKNMSKLHVVRGHFLCALIVKKINFLDNVGDEL